LYWEVGGFEAFRQEPTDLIYTHWYRWRKKTEGFDAAAGVIRGVLKRLFDYSRTAGLTPTNPVMALPMRHVHRKAEWSIPAEHSKTGKPHIVYLSPQALDLFAELRSLAGGYG
jgi:integrase